MFKSLGSIFRKGERKEGEGPLTGEPAVLVDVGRVWERGDVIEERYEIRRLLQSHTGILYILRHQDWDREIAMKTPDRRLYSGPEGQLRFRRECEAWQELGAHPNIAQLYYIKQMDDIPRLFIEYGPGTLAQSIAAGDLASLPQALDAALQICHGMEFAHRKGAIHRDLKSENILVTSKGTVKVTDFPFVRRSGAILGEESDPRSLRMFKVSDDRLRQMPGEVMGTPYAMAPEQWTAPFSIQKEANIYSFGVLLFEMICGRKPFEHDGKDRRTPLLALKMMHLFETPPDPRALNKAVPEELAQLVLRCLDKDPVRRPVSFMDGANQLRKIYKSLTGEDSPRRFITPERLKADNAHNRAITMLDLVPRSKRLEKAPEAVKILKEVISQRERHPEAPINIDLLAWELGTDSRGAITNRLRDRAAADPSYSFALRSFAWTLAQEGEAKNTLGLLERIAKREPDWGWIQNLRGILLLALDSPGQALTALERAAQLEPARWEYLYNLGVCLSRQGKHDEALDKMEKAMALSSDPRITVGMAVVLGALSRTPEAEEVLLSGHGRNGDSAWLNYHLGALYGAMGIRVPGFDSQEVDLKKSMGYLKASFQKAPGFHRVRDAIGEIGRRLNIQNIQRDLPSLIHRQPAGQEEKDLGTLWKARCYKVMNAHREGVLCVDISWDGRTIVSGGMDDVTCIWDPLTGQLVGLLRGHEDWVRAVCISADGSLILSGSKDGTARLWQRSDGRNLQTFKGHEGEIYGVAMSTDFRYGATGGDDRKLRIWDLRSGDLVRTLQGHKNRITSVALNYNGSRVLTGSVDRTVRLWDVESGKCIETMLGHEAEVNSVAMSNDGAFALSGCQDGSIRLWNLATGESLREFRGHEKEVRSVDIAPDLRFGLSGSWDGTVRLWDLGLGECICVMGGHEGPVMGVAILTDGRFGLSAGRDHSVRMWEWKEEALPLAIPPAALCPSDLTRVEREVEEDERFQSLFAGAQESLTRGDLAESYRLARIAQAVPEREREPLLMDLLAKITEKLERRSLRAGWVARTLKGHEDWIGAIALSSDDKLLLSGSLDTTMRLWDMERSETVRTFRGHGREVSCVAFFLDGSRVLSGSTDKTLRVWNRATGESVAVMKGHNHDVTGCAVVPDGGTAVSSSLDGTLRLWSTKNADQIRQIPVSEGVVYCTALSPDGRLAFSAGQDRTLRLWSTASGKAVRELKGHNAILRAVAVSPSSPHALTGGEDGSVCLWKIDTGETVHRMEGHEGAVLCAVFMPGGTHGVTGGEDGTLRFWDLGQGKAAGVLKAHEGPVRGVAVTSKGRNVISCSHDNLIRVWELDWEWEI